MGDSKLCTALGGLLGGLVLLASAPAQAGGFAVARFAGEHGHPTTNNPTALYFNPGALTLSKGTHVFIDANAGMRRVTYDRSRQPSDVPEPSTAQGANTGRARVLDALVVPSLSASTQLGNFALSLGWFTPFGGHVSWRERDGFKDHPRYPGPVDGVSRWHSIEGEILTTYLSLGGAYRFGDSGFSLGASLNLLISEIEDLRAYAEGDNDLRGEGRGLLDVSGVGVSFGVGATYEAMKDELWLGLSYQSRPNVSGGMMLEGFLDKRDYRGTLSVAKVDVLYDLPDVIRVGARYRPEPTIELRLFGDYSRWSALERHCIVQRDRPCNVRADGSDPNGVVLQNIEHDWHDSVEVRAGASIWTTPTFEFFSGLGYSSSAVPDKTFDAALPDFSYASFSLGGKHTLGEHLALALSYTHLVSVPRDVKSRLQDYQQPTRAPSASGSYKQQIGFVNANLDVSF